jgi:hypothetical protein
MPDWHLQVEGGAMDKIEQCVRDVMAIATAFGGHDLTEATRRIEILFADASEQAGGHFAVAQRLRDQLGLALNDTNSPARKQFLNDVIAWLERRRLGLRRGT